jgi:hypothetical protein
MTREAVEQGVLGHGVLFPSYFAGAPIFLMAQYAIFLIHRCNRLLVKKKKKLLFFISINQFNQKLKLLGDVLKYNLYYFLTHFLSKNSLDLKLV